jgi:tRNA U34 5-methylaminomethyl-2-thiouridine-forming methyltransferase MnmC
MNELKIIATGDGSPSLLNTTLNETYHSVHGARQESVHVFIQQGLDFFRQHHPPQPIAIFEMGFGTALNALLTAEYASQFNCEIQYTSIESFPLPENIWRSLNFTTSEESTKLFETLHAAPWSEETRFTDRFALTKIHSTLQSIDLQGRSFDIIYYDAFAPSKQPELWEMPMLSKVVSTLKEGSVFVTYCAKGQLKRDLKSLGLHVETLAGPPGKKEMVRAVK